MKIFITALTVFITTFATAQIPGFMGKRFALSSGIAISPASNPTILERKNVYVNKRYFVGLDIVTGRKWSIGLGYHIYNTAVDGIDTDNFDYAFGIKGNAVSINFTRYFTRKSNFIAPVGKYFSFGFMKSGFTLKDENGKYFPAGNKVASGSVSGITVSFGRKRVFFKKVLFDMALESALLLNFSQDKTGPEADMISKGAARVFYANLINVRLSAGYLF